METKIKAELKEVCFKIILSVSISTVITDIFFANLLFTFRLSEA